MPEREERLTGFIKTSPPWVAEPFKGLSQTLTNERQPYLNAFMTICVEYQNSSLFLGYFVIKTR